MTAPGSLPLHAFTEDDLASVSPDLRRRMCAYVQGPLGLLGRKNGWQLAEYAGHRTPAGCSAS
jgi:hypothetical protein